MVNKAQRIQNFNPKAETKPYLVTIQGIRALSLKDTKFGKPKLGPMGQMVEPVQSPSATYSVEYHATLFSNQVEPGLRGFYGHTCHSQPKKLKVS